MFNITGFLHVNDSWLSWKDTFLTICNKHKPTRESRLKNRHNNWINDEILNFMCRRDYLHNQYILLNSNLIRNKYLSLRNYIHKKNSAKKDYYRPMELECKCDPVFVEIIN